MTKRDGLNGRVATQDDVDRNECVFFIPSGLSTPYSFGHKLPLKALVTKPDDGDGFARPGMKVEIVQAELVNGEVILGVLYEDQEGVCSLDDVRIIEAR